MSSMCFASSQYRGSTHPEQWGGRRQVLPPKLHSASQHQATITSSCLCELQWLYLDGFCAAISKLQPKVIASSPSAILAYERFPRKDSTFRYQGKAVFLPVLNSFFFFFFYPLLNQRNAYEMTQNQKAFYSLQTPRGIPRKGVKDTALPRSRATPKESQQKERFRWFPLELPTFSSS